ncbi:MAG: flagellar hook-basal body protein FliE [Peptococcaceae bacterium BRH_c4a]|nr:MAG: flagellar hook-basal body protein FliE [Peptococcaceae bacterium BRH_c4a]
MGADNNKSQGADGDKSFGQMLLNALDNVNNAQVKSDDITKKFLVGDIQDIHQVTIAAEQARLMLQLAVEVRNKVIEAYQEISRMQV